MHRKIIHFNTGKTVSFPSKTSRERGVIVRTHSKGFLTIRLLSRHAVCVDVFTKDQKEALEIIRELLKLYL